MMTNQEIVVCIVGIVLVNLGLYLMARPSIQERRRRKIWERVTGDDSAWMREAVKNAARKVAR